MGGDSEESSWWLSAPREGFTQRARATVKEDPEVAEFLAQLEAQREKDLASGWGEEEG